MKRQIRQGVFETNSSSTHAVAILSDEEYKKYEDGDLLISRYAKLTTREEYDKIVEARKERSREVFEKLNQSTRDRYNNDFEKYWKDCYNDVEYEYDEENMEILHEERQIGNEKVHVLSVYGYED